MKRIFFSSLFLLFFSALLYGQNLRGLDKSPMDMAYFPDHFAHDRKGGEKPVARVIYSRPKKGGREIYGKLIPYGKVWRTGANEATEIKIYQDIALSGKKVAAGTYSLFTIPGEKEWTIILNSEVEYWGSFSYNAGDDIIRSIAPSAEWSSAVENLPIQFNNKGEKGGEMRLAWDKTVVVVPFTY